MRLLSDPSVVAGHLGAAARELARELDGERDAVRLRGVAPDLLDEVVFVGGPDLVAAFTAECLASEHVGPDTGSQRLDAC